MIRRFWGCREKEEGAVLIETAITLPLLILIISGIFELTNYALINNKMVRAAGVLGDMIARQNVTRSDLIALMQTADSVLTPYSKTQPIRVVVSQVQNNGATLDPTKMIISWQQQVNGATSKIGAVGATPVNLPNNVSVVSSQALLITEVFFNYVPLVFSGVLGNSVLYKISVFVPRLGTMSPLIGE